MSGKGLGGLPGLPPRPITRKPATQHASPAIPDHAQPGVDAVAKLASTLQASPAVQRLVSQPDLIRTVVQQDPTLQALFTQNPHLAQLVSGEKLQQVMELIKDPSSLLQQGAQGSLLPTSTDMSLNRKTLLELQHYSQNLQRRAMQSQAPSDAAAVPSTGWPGPQGAAGDASSSLMSVDWEQRLGQAKDRLMVLMQQRASLQGDCGASSPGISTAASIAEPGSASLSTRPSFARHQSEISFGSWQPDAPHFYSPASAYAMQQQRASVSGAGAAASSSSSSGGVRVMHAPLQHEPLYSGLHDNSGAGEGGYQGSYTFTHSERELPVQDLPKELQAQLLAQLARSGNGHADGSSPVAAGNHVHGPGCAHGEGCSESASQLPAAGSEEAKALYARLYDEYVSAMKVYEVRAAGGTAGAGLGVEKPDPGRMWAAYYQAYPEAAQAQGSGSTVRAGQPGLGGGLGAASHYETVTPSDWRPAKQEDCWELHRRAYCSKADGFWPPLWLSAALTTAYYLPTLPFTLLLLLMAGLFVCGMAAFAIGLAGIPSSQLSTSRVVFSFILTLEVVIWAAAVGWVLPGYTPRWGVGPLLLLASLTTLPCLHLICHRADPGFVRAATHITTAGTATTPGSSKTATSNGHTSGGLPVAMTGHNDDDGSDADEQSAVSQPLLAGQGGGGGSGRGGRGAGGQVHVSALQGMLQLGQPHLNTCSTCKVARPLRSKHCPVCDRCVDRFDHHCPAIYNCVGVGNQRLFAAYLLCMAAGQLSWLSVGFNYLQQQYQHSGLRSALDPAAGAASSRAAGAAAAELDARWCSWDAVQWAAGHHRCLLFLLMVQVPLTCVGVLLVGRQAFCIAANLTINELINRKRYTYLNHELAGYSNRFDQGAADNCFQFWCEPRKDWWTVWEQGDRAMVASGKTMLSVWSPGLLLRAADVLAVRRQAYARSAKEKRLAKQLQDQAGGTLEPEQLKRLVTQAMGQDSECGTGRCCDGDHHHHQGSHH